MVRLPDSTFMCLWVLARVRIGCLAGRFASQKNLVGRRPKFGALGE